MLIILQKQIKARNDFFVSFSKAEIGHNGVSRVNSKTEAISIIICVTVYDKEVVTLQSVCSQGPQGVE